MSFGAPFGRAAFAAAAALTVLGVLPRCGAAQSVVGRPIAIVVHPETRVDSLSMDELRRIFLADRQFWPDNSRITLLVRAPVAYTRTVVLDRIYHMSEDDFREYWIAKMFRAEVPTAPKLVYTTGMARQLVTAIPGAITFIPASAVGAGIKVLRINGRLPGEPGYPLQ